MPHTGNREGQQLSVAMARARLRDADVAVQLRVAPKTVDRWRHGRVPQTRHRWALADLLKVSEHDLWPQLAEAGEVTGELRATYDSRSAVPRRTWIDLFERAECEVGILVYSGLFIAEDMQILRTLARRAEAGVAVRLLLGDPDSGPVAHRGTEEGIDEALTAKIRNALVLYRPLLERSDVELRLHRTVLYNSLYRCDDDLLVNPHVYGMVAAHAPVLHLRRTDAHDELFNTYISSFERVWQSATPLSRAA